MKTTRIYLMVIAMLVFFSFLSHRDSTANPSYTCYVYEKGCE